MRVWRICRRRFARDAFDGQGARRLGGRWNYPGEAVVYTSATLSLAALEMFVNLSPAKYPADLVSLEANLPDDILTERVELGSLPRNWRATPSPIALQDVGSQWIASRRTAVLYVPSAVIPEDFNVLLNPANPDFQRLQIGRPRRFQFDVRMWKR